jgi:S-adenosylmethionine synthetase
MVDTFGTGDDIAAAWFVEQFDFRPGHIIRELDLLRPIYRLTTNYGHFGRPGLPWEKPVHSDDSFETLDQKGARLLAALTV